MSGGFSLVHSWKWPISSTSIFKETFISEKWIQNVGLFYRFMGQNKEGIHWDWRFTPKHCKEQFDQKRQGLIYKLGSISWENLQFNHQKLGDNPLLWKWTTDQNLLCPCSSLQIPWSESQIDDSCLSETFENIWFKMLDVVKNLSLKFRSNGMINHKP